MKLIFSLIFLLSQTVWSRDIIVIDHIQNNQTALLVKKILITKFQIPEKLIQINRQNLACDESKDAILHLCVDKDGNMEIKKINKYILKNAFNVFLDQNQKG
jgi:hypothetical protein